MGRQVERVPLDFNWPRKQVWEGFLMPKSLQPRACPDCRNTHGSGSDGYSPEGRELHNRWYGYVAFDPTSTGSTPLTADTPAVRAFAERNVCNSPEFYGSSEFAIRREAQRLADLWNKQWSHHLSQEDVDALVEGGRLHDFTHTFVAGQGWQPNDPPTRPTAAEVNEWSLRGMGHDSVNQWVVAKAYAARHGLTMTCATCKGETHLFDSQEAKEAYDNWEASELPKGDGWQMWENTSEGSPISPVFETPEELARWLADTGASTFGSDTATYDQWLRMIVGSGYAPSAIMVNGQVKSGVEGL